MKRLELFNNPPYMRAWAEIYGEKIFAKARTGEAVVIIPITEDGKVLLIEEYRESEEKTLLKSIGGFLREASLEEACWKMMKAEAGIEGGVLTVQYTKMIGFDILQIPIAGVVVTGWKITGGGDGKVIEMTLDEAAEKVKNHNIGDEAAASLISHLFIKQKLEGAIF